VFEMGMNRAGEIGELAAVLRPSLALVTNVGTAHIGILGSKDEIAKEKKKIFSRFGGTETAFIDEDEAYAGFLAEGLRGELVKYGPRSTPGFRGSASLGLDGTAVDWEGSRFALPLPGAHNLRNALGAISLALRAGCAASDVAEGLSSLKPLFGRGEVLRGRATVLRDCYNANPESAEAVIAFCDSVEWTGRKIYVMGSMLELGGAPEEAHAGLGRLLARSKADSILLFGEETRAALEAMKDEGFSGDVLMGADPAVISRALEARVAEGDLVLLKGSRGMRMEAFAGLPALSGGDAQPGPGGVAAC
jgi:UDP-N-acetylmuramoyl-tripeptide--D-alanyl-D-alanine ligase